MLQVDTIETVADKGYESREDILNGVMNGIVPNVALKYDKEERVYALEHEPTNISEQERNSTKPEDIQKCIHAGILPACYEGTAIQVEINEQSKISCFLLNNDGTVLYNSFWRKDHARRQVILRIRPDPKRLKQRMCLSEHPSDTVKWYHDAHYLLCKGKEKATAELGLSFLAYNMCGFKSHLRRQCFAGEHSLPGDFFILEWLLKSQCAGLYTYIDATTVLCSKLKSIGSHVQLNSS